MGALSLHPSYEIGEEDLTRTAQRAVLPSPGSTRRGRSAEALGQKRFLSIGEAPLLRRRRAGEVYLITGVSSHQTSLVGDAPISVASRDFNSDGMLDLATANFLSGDVSVLLGAGN